MGKEKLGEVMIKILVINIEHGDYYFLIFKLLYSVKDPKLVNELKLGCISNQTKKGMVLLLTPQWVLRNQNQNKVPSSKTRSQ
jgi:hypothetical protein